MNNYYREINLTPTSNRFISVDDLGEMKLILSRRGSRICIYARDLALATHMGWVKLGHGGGGVPSLSSSLVESYNDSHYRTIHPLHCGGGSFNHYRRRRILQDSRVYTARRYVIAWAYSWVIMFEFFFKI